MNTELGDLDGTGPVGMLHVKDRDWLVRIELLIGGDYRIRLRGLTRYYTDDTLPDGVRHPLGLLLFGAKEASVGQVIHHPFIPIDADRAFFVRVDENTARIMFGANVDDPRIQSQSQG